MSAARKKSTKTAGKTTKGGETNPFEFAPQEVAGTKADKDVHRFGKDLKFRCDTESRGHATPKGRSRVEIVVDASEGFVPLWKQNLTLRWRFRESTMSYFKNPTSAKAGIRKLLAGALLAWGDAAPVKFAERNDAWDFEIVMRRNDDCDASGCVLASSFFPDAGRHTLLLYPILFRQTAEEQVATLEHEIGHVFGLRHFFAKLQEADAPSEIFGKHVKFTIMNYGNDSHLTPADRSDLKNLYQLAWSGKMTHVNGTPIKFVTPFHGVGAAVGEVIPGPFAPASPEFEPQPLAAYTDRFGSQLVSR